MHNVLEEALPEHHVWVVLPWLAQVCLHTSEIFMRRHHVQFWKEKLKGQLHGEDRKGGPWTKMSRG